MHTTGAAAPRPTPRVVHGHALRWLDARFRGSKPKTTIFPSQFETLLWEKPGRSLHTGSRRDKCVFWILAPCPFPASFVACRVARPRARHRPNNSPLVPSPPVPQASRRGGAELCEAPFGVEGPVYLLASTSGVWQRKSSMARGVSCALWMGKAGSSGGDRSGSANDHWAVDQP